MQDKKSEWEYLGEGTLGVLTKWLGGHVPWLLSTHTPVCERSGFKSQFCQV